MSFRNPKKLQTLPLSSEMTFNDFKRSISFKKEHFESFEDRGSMQLLAPQVITEDSTTPQFKSYQTFSTTVSEFEPYLEEEHYFRRKVFSHKYNPNNPSSRFFFKQKQEACVTSDSEMNKTCDCEIF
jgi:hypothetical protein